RNDEFTIRTKCDTLHFIQVAQFSIDVARMSIPQLNCGGSRYNGDMVAIGTKSKALSGTVANCLYFLTCLNIDDTNRQHGFVEIPRSNNRVVSTENRMGHHILSPSWYVYRPPTAGICLQDGHGIRRDYVGEKH